MAMMCAKLKLQKMLKGISNKKREGVMMLLYFNIKNKPSLDKKQRTTYVGRDKGKDELLVSIGGNVNVCSFFGNQL